MKFAAAASGGAKRHFQSKEYSQQLRQRQPAAWNLKVGEVSGIVLFKQESFNR
jgi:hypothetical protein